MICVAAWLPLRSLFKLALANPEYSHILLVLPIVLGSLFLDPREDVVTGSPHRILAAILALIATTVWMAGERIVSGPDSLNLTLSVSAVVLAVWAVVCLTYGWSFFRSALFPMLFLLLLIPWPAVAIAKLTYWLQSGSTTAAYSLFKIFGVPVTRSGFLLSLPSMDIEVAKECSGIRSTVMLFLAALVLGHWFLRSALRKTVLALAVFPIGILRNGIRIFVLSILGTYVDEGWLEGNLHHRGGSVFFVLGLVLIVMLLWLLRRADHRSRNPFSKDGRISNALEGGKV